MMASLWDALPLLRHSRADHKTFCAANMAESLQLKTPPTQTLLTSSPAAITDVVVQQMVLCVAGA